MWGRTALDGPRVLRVQGTEGSGVHGRAFGGLWDWGCREVDSGDAGGSDWTLYRLHPLYPLPTLKLLNPWVALHHLHPVFPVHPSAPGPSFCNLRSFFGVLTHSCAPDTWNSNMCHAVHPVQMCLCSPTCVVGDIWQCTPTPNHAPQYLAMLTNNPAVHPDTWLSPPAHGPPTCVRHALHPNPHPGVHLGVHTLPHTLS